MKSKLHSYTSDKIFQFFNYAFLGTILLLVFYPILYVFSASFSSPGAIMAGKVWLIPVEPTLEGYTLVFNNAKIWRGFYNSLYYTVLGTIINVSLTIMIAYPVSRKDFYPRNIIIFIFVFTMWFSGGLIPTYLQVKNLGLVDTRWAMMLPNAISVYNMIITVNYFRNNIPWEISEAARIDGCNDYGFLIKILIPLSKPIIAVISLYYAVTHWNSFFNAFIYLKSQELFPLQVILRDILIMNTVQDIIADQELRGSREMMSEVLKNSLIVIATIPMIIIFPFVQKYFVKGIMIGAIKG